MKYRELIEKLAPYADEKVSIVHCMDELIFFTEDDGNTELVHLELDTEEPCGVKRIIK